MHLAADVGASRNGQGGVNIAVYRIHRYTVAAAGLAKLIARRASFPEARAAMSLTRDATAVDEIVDER